MACLQVSLRGAERALYPATFGGYAYVSVRVQQGLPFHRSKVHKLPVLTSLGLCSVPCPS